MKTLIFHIVTAEELPVFHTVAAGERTGREPDRRLFRFTEANPPQKGGKKCASR
jgi:hypothetical protein